MNYKKLRLFIVIQLLMAGGSLIARTSQASISGTVRDANTSQPIEDVMVVASAGDLQGGNFILVSTETGPDGTYRMEPLREGRYRVFTIHPEYQRGDLGEFDIGPDTQLTGLDFRLTPLIGGINNLISGRVSDSRTGEPLAGVSIALTQSGVVQFQTESDAQGNYRFENVNPGFYQLAAMFPDYLQQGSAGLLIVEPTSQLVLDIEMFPTTGGGDGVGSLSGFVYEEGGVPGDPKALFPARIKVFGRIEATGDTIFVLRFNRPDGSYAFDFLPLGTYTITCEAFGFIPFQVENFIIAEGENQLDFFLTPIPPPRGSISGTVSDSQSGQPISDARLYLTNALISDVRFTTLSDENGQYLFDEIFPGTFVLFADAPGYIRKQVDTLIVVEPETDPVTVDILLEPGKTGGSIGGFVNDADNGQPVEEAWITAIGYGTEGDSLFFFTVSLADGSYRIDDMPAGKYIFRIRHPQYRPKVSGLINLNPEANLNNVSFQLTPQDNTINNLISGTVVDALTGEPLAGARVSLTFTPGSGVRYQLVSAEDGTFRFENVFPGTYYLMAEAADYSRRVPGSPLAVEATSQFTDLIIEMFPIPIQVTVRGGVTDNNLNPLEGAVVRVFPNIIFQNPIDSLFLEVLTDAQGNYSLTININSEIFSFIASAEKENYFVEFWQEKPSIVLADPILVTGDTLIEDINFTLDPVSIPADFSISGTVTDAVSGDPLSNAFIVGSNLSDGKLVFVFSDTGGRYQLSGLDRAHYVILFAAEGHVPEFYDDAFIWEEATPVFADGDISGINAALNPVNANAVGGMISGIVKSRDNLALPGVLITIQNDSGKMVGFDFSSPDGAYRLPGIINGGYKVQATKISYQSIAQQVQYDSHSGVLQVDFTLTPTVVGVDPLTAENLPEKFELSQNFPNPFNPVTTIRFALPRAQVVRLAVYNILGQEVAEILNEFLPAGRYELTWDGTDHRGVKVSSGIYFCSLEARDFQATRKMLLAR